MTNEFQPNFVRSKRLAASWSQQELADRTGLSRAGVGAIEAGRLAPSVHAALALARALDSTVEELFGSPSPHPNKITWGITPNTANPRFWYARVNDAVLAYPVSEETTQLDWHDSVDERIQLSAADQEKADQTLVMAGCDPAASLLALEYQRQFQFRMILLRRNSQESLDLLADGMVHVAGMHFGGGTERSANRRAAKGRLGKNAELVHVASWEEGIAVHPSVDSTNVASLLRSRVRWIGREEGSGARQLQNEILGGKQTPKHIAQDHRMVASAIKSSWAEAGPCVRLVSEEAGLRFLSVHRKNYDFCFHAEMAADPRISALLATLRSRRFRTKLAELPGYRTDQTGEGAS